MWTIYLNFCTVIGFIVTASIALAFAGLAGILIFVYLLDKSSGGA